MEWSESFKLEQPVINIVGEKVSLGPRSRTHLPLFQRWINDFEVTRTLAAPLHPFTFEAEEDWYNGVARSNKPAFTIYDTQTLQPIGGTDLDVNPLHRTATFGLMIGEKKFWGKGCGSEATALMLDYGFTLLDLHNIMLNVYSFNERAIRAYRRAGFREFGRRREAFRFGGRVFDVVYMDCLATEFEKSAFHHLLPGEP